jgi:E3 ubiquitin-protein ligase SHPRH
MALPLFELQPPQGPRKHFKLIARIAWKTEVPLSELSRSSNSRLRFEHDLWRHYLASQDDFRGNAAWSIQDFYEIVHTPPKSIPEVASLKRLTGSCDLFPFQNRTVQWALTREGVTIQEDGQVVKFDAAERHPSHGIPISFRFAVDADGRPCYVSSLRGMVTTTPSMILDGRRDLRGGVLAEEMGLGKTVELISLINTHKRNGTLPSEDIGSESSKIVHDFYTNTKVVEGGGTLVITPQSILDQWLTELRMHSPNLRVHHYRGVSSLKYSKATDEEVVKNLLEHDVVVTTYAVLAREIHYAKPPPERNLRGEKRYEPRKSPLVQISWWRVCLDEAQMVESGVSHAATVARLIPRINAWAISGTPLRRDVQDLLGLLIFLRYEPFCGSKKLWQKAGKDILKEVFGQIALRHTKSNVRDELRLPYQLRYVIMQPFTAIEEQNYRDLVRQMCDELDLSPEGAPLTDDFEPDSPATIEKMRQWLRRLRQTCVHPLVGGRNRRALGRGARPLRTVDEVLEVMIDQNDVILRNEERKLLSARVNQGHIIANNKADTNRGNDALKVYRAALEEANRIVDECAQELTAESEKSGSAANGLADIQDTDSTDSNEGQQDDEKNPRLSRLRKALRSAREIQHVCNFFTATAYFQIKSEEAITPKDSEQFHQLENQETKFYDEAKAIRQQLLRATRRRAERTMKTVSQKGGADIIRPISLLEDDFGGIENRKLLDQMDSVFERLNKQRQLIHEWRAKVIEILVSPLLDEDADGKEITGEEYESSTKTQDELYVYLTSLRALVADRNFILSGQSNILIEHEVKSAMQQAKWGEGHAPELLLQCMEKRRPLAPAKDSSTFRGVIAQARSTANALAWQRDGGRQRAGAELEIVEMQLKRVAPLLSDQSQELVNMEKEMEVFRSCMNQRVEFYRQLQHISDMVAPWREELDEELDTTALNEAKKTEQNADNRLTTYKTKKRFLDHLRLDAKDETTRTCIICQDTYMSGILTVCGHKFCRECITLWWKENRRTCPVSIFPSSVWSERTLTPTRSASEQSSLMTATISPTSQKRSGRLRKPLNPLHLSRRRVVMPLQTISTPRFTINLDRIRLMRSTRSISTQAALVVTVPKSTT